MRYRGLVNVRVVAARLARLDDLAFHVRPVDRQRKRRFQRPDGNLLLQFLGEPGTAEALICPRARPHNLVRVDAPRDAAQLELADDIGVYLDGLLDHHKIGLAGPVLGDDAPVTRVVGVRTREHGAGSPPRQRLDGRVAECSRVRD